MTTKVTETKLAEINPDQTNANEGTERGRAALESSLRIHGAGRSILLDRERRIIAGNKTVEEAGQIGLDDVIIVKTDGTKLVAVQREDLDLADDSTGARELAYADNRVGELDLSWNPEQVLADLDAGIDLSGLFREDELSEILGELGQNGTGEDVGPQIDKAAELQTKWGTATGQVWELGEHRLACGDCTDKAVVESVMRGNRAGCCVTDPPYGIEREGIINDKPEDLRPLFDDCLFNLPIDNGVIIAFQSPRLEWVWLDAIRNIGHKLERLLWMYKPNDETKPWRGWLLTSEAIRVSSVGKAKWSEVHPYAQDCYVYKHDETLGELQGAHTTVKPLRITADLISRVFGDVYDPFLGSGTTLIACEQLGRKCRGIEISPAYVGVTLERWQTMTGKDPVLIK